MGARYYQPTTARFTQVDPPASSVFTANRYHYAGCDPSNATDPTGLWLEYVGGEGCDYAVTSALFQAAETFGFALVFSPLWSVGAALFAVGYVGSAWFSFGSLPSALRSNPGTLETIANLIVFGGGFAPGVIPAVPAGAGVILACYDVF